MLGAAVKAKCTHVCERASVFVCACMCVHCVACVHLLICVRVCVCTCVCRCMDVRMCACTCMCVRACVGYADCLRPDLRTPPLTRCGFPALFPSSGRNAQGALERREVIMPSGGRANSALLRTPWALRGASVARNLAAATRCISSLGEEEE